MLKQYFEILPTFLVAPEIGRHLSEFSLMSNHESMSVASGVGFGWPDTPRQSPWKTSSLIESPNSHVVYPNVPQKYYHFFICLDMRKFGKHCFRRESNTGWDIGQLLLQ